MIVCYDPFRATTADQLTVYFYRKGPNKTSKYITNGEIKSTLRVLSKLQLCCLRHPINNFALGVITYYETNR